MLAYGFSLGGQDAQISFELATGEMYRVDIEKTGEAIPKYQKLSTAESEYLREYLNSQPEENQIKLCVDMLNQQINKSDRLVASEIKIYINRIINNMTKDELAALKTSVPTYARKIQLKIDNLETEYRKKSFQRMLDNGKIVCRPSYIFPNIITPIDNS